MRIEALAIALVFTGCAETIVGNRAADAAGDNGSDRAGALYEHAAEDGALDGDPLTDAAWDDPSEVVDGGCAAGRSLCDGRCVNTANDSTHCGQCGRCCPGACVRGVCADVCGEGFQVCYSFRG